MCTGACLPCLPICNKFHEKKHAKVTGLNTNLSLFSTVKFGKPRSQQIHTRYPIMMLMIRVLASSPNVENHHHYHHHHHHHHYCHHHHQNHHNCHHHQNHHQHPQHHQHHGRHHFEHHFKFCLVLPRHIAGWQTLTSTSTQFRA